MFGIENQQDRSLTSGRKSGPRSSYIAALVGRFEDQIFINLFLVFETNARMFLIFLKSEAALNLTFILSKSDDHCCPYLKKASDTGWRTFE